MRVENEQLSIAYDTSLSIRYRIKLIIYVGRARCS